MENEVWKDIEGYEGLYMISNLGRVKSLARKINYKDGRRHFTKERILKVGDYKDWYLYVVLKKDTVPTTKKIHRLVAEAFISNPENKPCVNHKNANKKDSSIKNLEWVTFKENSEHAFKAGLIPKGIESFHAKLTEKKVLEIREKYMSGKHTHTSLAKIYKVSSSQIGRIIRKKRWGHI